MTVFVLANGQSLTCSAITSSDVSTALASAAPSAWLTIDLDNIGTAQVNMFVVAYYY